MSARRTRRSGGTGRAGGSKCAWCKHMGSTVDACTWKPRGQQGWFMSGSDVAPACFGHMVASVWDGSAVRRGNKNFLKRCLALSVAERGNGAGAPPQHAWAASLLDACKLQEIRSRRSCSSSESSNSDSDSDLDIEIDGDISINLVGLIWYSRLCEPDMKPLRYPTIRRVHFVTNINVLQHSEGLIAGA